MWAYPREFGDADAAGQVTGSPNRFTTVHRRVAPLPADAGLRHLRRSDDADHRRRRDGERHLRRSAGRWTPQAAVDKVVEMGVADRDRIGVGGHSYGAFMTANLLAHTDLFRAGIARSGAYNRTLTPFGFQSETPHLLGDPGDLRADVAVLLRRQDQRADPADPRRGGRQLRHLPDPVRAALHGAQGLRRDGALRHAAQRGARLRRARVHPPHHRRNDQLARQVREERAAARENDDRAEDETWRPLARYARRNQGGAGTHQAGREGHAARRCLERRGPAALAEVREPAAGRRVQDPRRLQHGRAAHGRATPARRHHLLVRQPRPGRRHRRPRARHTGGRRDAHDGAEDQGRRCERVRRGNRVRGNDVPAPAGQGGSDRRGAGPDDGAALRSSRGSSRARARWAWRSSINAATSAPSSPRSAAAAWSPAWRRQSNSPRRTSP